MKTEMKYQVGHSIKKTISLMFFGLVVAGTMAGPAAADDWRRHEERERHEHWEHERWEHRHYYVPPPVFVAPRPRAYYVPPPVVVMPPVAPGYRIMVPVYIR
jgi:hypothetical protein